VGDLTQRRCDVWLAATHDYRPWHDKLLDGPERVRCSGFLRSADRTRFVLAAALTKIAAARVLAIAPADVHVDRACSTCGAQHGRPILSDTDLHVSVTHSGSTVAVALTRAGPVGVDIEARSQRVLPAADLIVTPAEPVRTPHDLLTYWCRKESVMKATGDGLRVPPTEVVVSPAGVPPRLLSYLGRPRRAAMTDLDLDGSLTGALTVLADDIDVHLHDARHLLAQPAGH
jgi:4'-phosphopantetheinyl transferase